MSLDSKANTLSTMTKLLKDKASIIKQIPDSLWGLDTLRLENELPGLKLMRTFKLARSESRRIHLVILPKETREGMFLDLLVYPGEAGNMVKKQEQYLNLLKRALLNSRTPYESSNHIVRLKSSEDLQLILKEMDDLIQELEIHGPQIPL